MAEYLKKAIELEGEYVKIPLEENKAFDLLDSNNTFYIKYLKEYYEIGFICAD